MRPHFGHYILLTLIGLAPIVTLAYADVIPSPEAVKGNEALFNWVLGLALISVVILLCRWIEQSDANNKEQWTKINKNEFDISEVEKDVLVLRVEHSRNHGGTGDTYFRRTRDE